MAKYILLCPLELDAFNIESHEELLEALSEFGCSAIHSHLPNGSSVWFAVADTLKALTQMCETVELPGVALEYSKIYDQAEIIS